MKTVKVSEASGVVLDWLVAKCEGFSYEHYEHNRKKWAKGDYRPRHWMPSTDPAQGWPIIEREMQAHGFDVWKTPDMNECAATYTRGVPSEYVFGPTALIAAMRCRVVSKLGETVEVPEELL